MKRFPLLLLVVLLALTNTALAQTDTPTATPTLTPTPTNTATAVAVTPLSVSTPTPLPYPIFRRQEGGSANLGPLVVGSGDLFVQPAEDGGNAGARNELIGRPRQTLVALGTMTNGSTETTQYIDDSPAGEWSAIDSDVTVSADTSTYRVGSTSLALAFAATAAADDGASRSITSDNLSSNEYIGAWVRTSEDLAAGDLVLEVRDTSDGTAFLLPAIKRDRWTWVEIDVSVLDGTTGNACTGLKLKITSQGASAHGAFTVDFDAMYKWDATDEEALSVDVIQDGIVGVVTVATAAGSANTPAVLTEGTDYFVAYRQGNDSLVTITDQSSNSGLALVARQ